jgi:hypothetical protein
MKPINSQYIFSKEDATEMVLVGLQLLDMIPKSGYGRTEFIFDNDILVDTICSNRTRPKIKIMDVLKKFFHVD